MNEKSEAVVTEKIETSRPAWQKPALTEISIDEVTACCYALGGNDGTPSVTSIS
ncbi:hypothetical protein ACFSM5_17495 [Lacibacterium aquatile]|uniref:Uncharacterized protein n=1 Tax=Lacibacterium aquatile TaxID=1168082 RepID=A0ABW5DUA4_9PROT